VNHHLSGRALPVVAGAALLVGGVNLASYAAAGAPPPLCFVTDSRREFAVVAGAQVVAGTAIVNGTGPVTVAATGAAALICEANGGLTSPVGVRFANTLTFTLVRSVHRGTLRSFTQPRVDADARKWRGR
jgi:hypothetical protein